MLVLWLYWRAREKAAFYRGVRAAWVFMQEPFNEVLDADEVVQELR